MAGTTTVQSNIDIPGDVMIEGTIMVVSYIGADGTSRYAWTTKGEYSAAVGLGLLEIVKHQILHGIDDGD